MGCSCDRRYLNQTAGRTSSGLSLLGGGMMGRVAKALGNPPGVWAQIQGTVPVRGSEGLLSLLS